MIQLTESAASELRRLMEERGLRGAAVRVGVHAGGCSGLQYSLDLDDRETAAEDSVFSQGGLRVVCDPDALPLLDGLTVDHSDGLVGGGFSFRNPKARRSCGCGASFRV